METTGGTQTNSGGGGTAGLGNLTGNGGAGGNGSNGDFFNYGGSGGGGGGSGGGTVSANGGNGGNGGYAAGGGGGGVGTGTGFSGGTGGNGGNGYCVVITSTDSATIGVSDVTGLSADLTTLQNNIDAETARAEAAEANLQSQIDDAAVVPPPTRSEDTPVIGIGTIIMAYVSGDGGNDYKVGDTIGGEFLFTTNVLGGTTLSEQMASGTVFACCGYSEPNGANGYTTTIWQRIS
ncbi:MAG TPA: hypothetical protein VJM78_03335 [Rhizomicrobium sp.]|nr:hypothetical protein [Rhizomicrobium sp.]